MHLDAFRKLVIPLLISRQRENGSWIDDGAATCSALEALIEHQFGPEPFCRRSWVHRLLKPFEQMEGWPLRFSYGLETDSALDVVGSIFRGLRYGWERVSAANSWLLAKWIRLFSMTDPDFWPPGFPHELYDYPDKTLVIEPRETWLLAQMAESRLHFDVPNEMFQTVEATLKRKHHVCDAGSELLQALEIDHWTAKRTSAEEATALVCSFLFHDCTTFMMTEKCVEPDVTGHHLRDGLASQCLSWLLSRQAKNGSWLDSFHVTCHCITAMTRVVGAGSVTDIASSVEDAIRRALIFVTSPAVVKDWEALATYQQVDTVTALTRVLNSERGGEISRDIDIDSPSVRPDVFISYAGVDAEFAKSIATALERSGVRVWFAEWDLDYGDEVVGEIEKGLETTTKFLIVLSPDAISRAWVRQELAAAFHQALSGRGKLILPLMYKATQIPPFLASRKWIDFSRPEARERALQELVRRLQGKKRARE